MWPLKNRLAGLTVSPRASGRPDVARGAGSQRVDTTTHAADYSSRTVPGLVGSDRMIVLMSGGAGYLANTALTA